MATETLRPTGAGSTTGMTPSAGANYQCVDEATLDTGDNVYIGFLDGTKYDTYQTANPSTIGGSDTINFVTVYAVLGKGDTPDDATGKIAVRIGGTVYYGSNITLNVGNTLYSNKWTTNPNTSSAWTLTNIQDMEIGVSLTLNGFRCYCYQVYAVVDFTAGSTTVIPIFMNQYRQRRA